MRTMRKATGAGSTRTVKIHQYLEELNAATFGTDAEIVTVGEMSSTSLENCYQYANGEGTELSMVFSFHHLKVDFMGNEKWVLVPYDFSKLKKIMFQWQTSMAEHNAWNAVFWCNHDQPRVVTRFGDEGDTGKNPRKCSRRSFTACGERRIFIRARRWA